MSTLATAISNERWELAAHVLVLAALQTLNGEGPVLGTAEGPMSRRPKGGERGDGEKRRRGERQTSRP